MRTSTNPYGDPADGCARIQAKALLRALISVMCMLTVSPIVAVTALVCWNPERWGGSFNPLAILAMSFFGIITVPLWPTYIPAIAVTPFIMQKVSASTCYRTLPLWIILGIAFFIGAVAGVSVISIIVPWHEARDLVLNWITAGAVSGGVTLTLISIAYRL